MKQTREEQLESVIRGGPLGVSTPEMLEDAANFLITAKYDSVPISSVQVRQITASWRRRAKELRDTLL